MTDETAPTAILPDSRTRRVALAVALAAVTLLGTAGAVTAQSDQPTISVDGATTAADDTATVEVVLTEAPDGLSGYYLSLAVEDGTVARIESASYPDRFGLTTDPGVGPEGRTITLEAADVEGTIESGATDVTLATVEVTGAAPGEARITVEPRQFDSDDGTQFQPATQPGVVAVEGGATDAASSDAGGETDDTTGSDATDSDTADSDATGGDGDGASSDAGSGTSTTAGDGSDANAELFGFSAPLLGGVVIGVVAALIAVGLGRRL